MLLRGLYRKRARGSASLGVSRQMRRCLRRCSNGAVLQNRLNFKLQSIHSSYDYPLSGRNLR